MKVNFAVTALAAAGLSIMAWADMPPPPPAPPSPPQAEDPPAPPDLPKEDPTVCKKFKTTGSRLPTEKICKKQSEWDAEAEEAQRALNRVQSTPAQSGSSGGGQ